MEEHKQSKLSIKGFEKKFFSSYTPQSVSEEKIEQLQNSICVIKDTLTQNVAKNDKRLVQLEKDREFLLQKNKELEVTISRLENMMSQQNSLNVVTPGYQTPKKLKKVPLSKSIERSGITNIRITQAHKKNEKNSTKKFFQKSTSHRSTGSGMKKYSTIKEREEHENKELNYQIKQMNKTINNLNDEIQLNILEEKGDSYLLYELDMWKQKTDRIGKEFMMKLNTIKKTLFEDKVDYQNQISSIQNLCNLQLKKLKEKCSDTVSKQEFIIETYLKQNAEMKRKLDKIKNIFHH